MSFFLQLVLNKWPPFWILIFKNFKICLDCSRQSKCIILCNFIFKICHEMHWVYTICHWWYIGLQLFCYDYDHMWPYWNQKLLQIVKLLKFKEYWIIEKNCSAFKRSGVKKIYHWTKHLFPGLGSNLISDSRHLGFENQNFSKMTSIV